MRKVRIVDGDEYFIWSLPDSAMVSLWRSREVRFGALYRDNLNHEGKSVVPIDFYSYRTSGSWVPTYVVRMDDGQTVEIDEFLSRYVEERPA